MQAVQRLQTGSPHSLRFAGRALLVGLLVMSAFKTLSADVITLEPLGIQFWKPLQWQVSESEDGWVIQDPKKHITFESWAIPAQEYKTAVWDAYPTMSKDFADLDMDDPGPIMIGDGENFGAMGEAKKKDGRAYKVLLAAKPMTKRHAILLKGTVTIEAFDAWETSIARFLEGWKALEILPQQGPTTLTCASYDKKEDLCSTGFPIARADVQEQLSKKDCTEGKTWSLIDDGRLLVTGGCRAIFHVHAAPSPQKATP